MYLKLWDYVLYPKFKKYTKKNWLLLKSNFSFVENLIDLITKNILNLIFIFLMYAHDLRLKILFFILTNEKMKKVLVYYEYTKLNYVYEKFKMKLDEDNFISQKEIEFNKIIKQNGNLTTFETLSLIITSKSNRSFFYSPLQSFFPLFISGTLLFFFLILVAIFFKDQYVIFKNWLFIFSAISLSISLSFWFSVFYLEKKKGYHNIAIKLNILFGFYVFIFTEALCFLSMFWTFLHSMLASSIHIGIYNPGEGITNVYINEDFLNLKRYWDTYGYHLFGDCSRYNTSESYTLFDRQLFSYKPVKVHINLFDPGSLISPYGLPFINTLILLCSAASLNASHCLLMVSKFFRSSILLFITIVLGVLFIMMQFKEYKLCSFNYNDGIYSASFLGITGLHGIHVMIGIVCLFISLINIYCKNYMPKSHQTFYFSIFYWHFVDIIWIAVWFVIYLWPGAYFYREYSLASKASDTYFIVHISINHFWNVVNLNYFSYSKIGDVYFYNSFYNNFSFLNTPINQVKNDYQLFIDNYNDFNFVSSFEYFILKRERYYFDLSCLYDTVLNNKKLFNLNMIKRDPKFFCAVMDELHYDIFRRLDFSLTDDLVNKPKRFFLFFIFWLFNESLAFFYCKGFLSMMSNCNIWKNQTFIYTF